MDDEVEITGEGSAHRVGPMLCQMCNADIEKLSCIQRQQHYDAHLGSSSKPPSGNPRTPTIPKDLFKPLRFPKPERKKISDQFWYPAMSSPPPDNFSPGLITILKHALRKSHAKGKTCRAVLCIEEATHISIEAFDRGWGCGYRNFLMACAALMNQQIQSIYFALLDDPIPPGVRNLQHWIEAAWKEGYDPEGAKDLKNSVVDSKKWLGTGELYTAFTSRGVPSQLVDFELSKSERGVQIMIDWIVNYFSPSPTKQDTVTNVLRGASPVISTNKMPLILQFSGHSQTIIGYEISKSGDKNILIFDPSKPPRPNMRRAAIAGPSSCVWKQSRSNHMLQTVMHPTSAGLSSSRKRPSSSSDTRQQKRSKSSESDDDIIIIDDLDELHENDQRASVISEPLQSFTLDQDDVVNFFRLSASKLKRKEDYQILFFPMTDPWSIEERGKRKIVTSIRGC